jgi:outer membrane protein
VALSALLAPPVSAQEPPVPAALTLDEAIEIARERNPQYRQAVYQRRAAGVRVRSSLGQFLPTVSASLGFSGYSSQRVTGEDDFGKPVSLTDPIDFRGSSASQSIGGSLTLFDGLRNLNTLRASRATVSQYDAAEERAAQQLEAETTRRFYEVLRTERLVALEERLLESSRQQLAITERLFRTAGATREDVLGAQADLANQELAVARAQGDVEKAVLLLKEQMGVTEDVAIDPVGELPEVFDPSQLEGDHLVAAAGRANAELGRLEATATAAALRATAARGARWPTVRANASYSRGVSLSSYDALFELNPQNRTFSFGLSIDWSLFSGFQVSQQIAQADVDARTAEENLRAAQLRIGREVRSALIDVRNAYRGLQLARQSAELSRERLALAQERYAIADISFANLQLIINQAAQAERQLVSAEYEYARAVVTLEEAVGTEIGP